jgi:ketopantoate reductase
MKRVVVLGAGAIGSTVAMRLALAGHDVTVVARGSRLESVAARWRDRDGDRPANSGADL